MSDSCSQNGIVNYKQHLTNDGIEVDFILERPDGAVLAIEKG
jgi:hypothetical protein